jgi:hypothetical protein
MTHAATRCESFGDEEVGAPLSKLDPAEVAELADATDLKSVGPHGPCGFDSRPRHQRKQTHDAEP